MVKFETKYNFLDDCVYIAPCMLCINPISTFKDDIVSFIHYQHQADTLLKSQKLRSAHLDVSNETQLTTHFFLLFGNNEMLLLFDTLG